MENVGIAKESVTRIAKTREGGFAWLISRRTSRLVCGVVFLLFAFVGPCTGTEQVSMPVTEETVRDYANSLKLEPRVIVGIGNDVGIDLVIIPAGRFNMGSRKVPPVNEIQFDTETQWWRISLAINGAIALGLLLIALFKAYKRRRFQVSLGILVLLTICLGGVLLSGLKIQGVDREIEQARSLFNASKIAFESFPSDVGLAAHDVTLTKPFYMSKFPITQRQYREIQGVNPSLFLGDDKPVERVSWDDAQIFCLKASALLKKRVRLPTEAEWEYACRAGTSTNYYSGDSEINLAGVAWYAGNSGGHSHPVGQKIPNAFGLYDMHGNVYQWCSDLFLHDPQAVFAMETVDPQSPIDNTGRGLKGRVIRGGMYGNEARICKSVSRFGCDQDKPNSSTGFRIVVECISSSGVEESLAR